VSAAGALDVHEVSGWVLIGVNAVAGAWALAAHRFEALRGRPLWIVVIVGQSMAFVQAFIGVVLTSRYDYELDDMHALYGFSAIIAVGILFSYRTSPFMKGKELVLYGFGSLFIMGLGLRNLYL
jgi:uncharacterized membrane protein